METVVLREKIDSLPDDLKEQVADYIDFLLYRYHESLKVLTDEEKVELDERWTAYQQGTLLTSKLEDVRKRLEKRLKSKPQEGKIKAMEFVEKWKGFLVENDDKV